MYGRESLDEDDGAGKVLERAPHGERRASCARALLRTSRKKMDFRRLRSL